MLRSNRNTGNIDFKFKIFIALPPAQTLDALLDLTYGLSLEIFHSPSELLWPPSVRLY